MAGSIGESKPVTLTTQVRHRISHSIDIHVCESINNRDLQYLESLQYNAQEYWFKVVKKRCTRGTQDEQYIPALYAFYSWQPWDQIDQPFGRKKSSLIWRLKSIQDISKLGVWTIFEAGWEIEVLVSDWDPIQKWLNGRSNNRCSERSLHGLVWSIHHIQL